jgi:hypothetical protein
MSKILDEVLAANTKYAENFGDKGNLPLPPSRCQRRTENASAGRRAGVRMHHNGCQTAPRGRLFCLLAV